MGFDLYIYIFFLLGSGEMQEKEREIQEQMIGLMILQVQEKQEILKWRREPKKQ